MRLGNDAQPRVALPPAALSSLNASIGNGRAALLSPVEPRVCPIPAPEPASRVSVNPRISLKPSGFPSLRENL